MNTILRRSTVLGLFLGVSLVARGAQPEAPKGAPAPAAPTAEPEIPQSVFVVPASPKEGRNPFFPNSAAKQAAPKPKSDFPDVSNFVLNGITSPPKRTAMINGRTLEKGESTEMRLANGSRYMIQCLDIGDDKAIIMVANRRVELRLRGGI
jgi:hypothetical protein